MRRIVRSLQRGVRTMGGQCVDSRRRIPYVVLFVLFAASLVFVGKIYWNYSKSVYNNDLARQISAIADLKVQQLTQWRSEWRHEVSVLSSDEGLATLMERYLETPSDVDVQEGLRDKLGKLQRHRRDGQFFLLDLNGAQRLAEPADAGTVPPLIARRVPEALQLNEIVFQDLYRDENTSRPLLGIIAPVYHPNSEQPLGVIVASIDPEIILYPLIETWPVPSETAETLLVREERGGALFLSPLRFKPDAALSLRIPESQTNVLAVKAVQGKEGFHEGEDYRGAHVVGVVRKVPDSPWMTVSRIDLDEAYAPIRARRWLLGLVLSLLFTGAGAMFALAWRQRNVRYKVERLKTEEELRESNQELEIRNRLAHVFLAHSGDDIYYKSLQIFLEATESKHGIFGYLDENGDYVCPSLTEEVWGNCRKDERGRVFPKEAWTGVWGKALLENKTVCSNKMLQQPQGYFPVINALSVPLSFHGKVIGNVLVGDKSTPYDEHDIRILEGLALEVAPVLNAMLQREREEKERQRAEAELQETAQRLQLATESAGNGMWHWDMLSDTLVWDDRMCALYGVRREEFEGNYAIWEKRVHPDDLELFQREVANARASERPLYMAFRVILPNNDIRYIETHAVVQRSRNAHSMVGLSRDITDRKRMDERLTQQSVALVNSRQAALSLLQDTQLQQQRAEAALERATVAEREAKELAEWAQGFQTAGEELASCLTVEEVAAFAARAPMDYLQMNLAWVAVLGEDLLPIQILSGMPENKQLALDAPCVHEAGERCESIIVEDTLNGPRVGSRCVERAREFGFRSCASFPISAGGRCVAVLTVRDLDSGPGCRLVRMQPLVEVFCRQAGHVWQRCRDEEEKHKLAQAIEACPATVVITDISGNITYVNPRFTETTGYTREEAIGANPRVLKSGSHPPEFYRNMWKVLRSGNEWQGEFCNRKKNGELYWEHASISSVRDSRGATMSYIAVKEDITESKRMVEALLQMKAEADRANRAKSLFLANMSHEIRTPMTAILGYCQLMERDTPLTPQQARYLHTINHSGEHLLGLINDILDMSKIEAGRTTLNPTTFDLPALLGDIEAMFRTRTDAKGLFLEVEYMGPIPRTIHADVGKVRQVLINILGNAVKFTDEGGLAVRVQAREDGECVRIVIEVEDSGCGIPPHELELVFGAFEQAQNAQNRGGTGLGMPISRQYARMMGGDLTLVSEVGKGSVFRFEFSAARGNELSLPPSRKRSSVAGLAPGQGELRILIVDDRRENRDLLNGLLTRVGFKTREARDGEEAIDVFEEWHPQAVLMDIRMFGMDGLEATRRIKALPEGAKTTVIIISASVMEEDRRSAMASGAEGFIRKPFRQEEVFDELEQRAGISFVYETSESDAAPESAGKRLAPEALNAFSREVVRRMYEAVSTARIDEFLRLLSIESDREPELAQTLQTLAENFNYDALLALFAQGAEQEILSAGGGDTLEMERST